LREVADTSSVNAQRISDMGAFGNSPGENSMTARALRTLLGENCPRSLGSG
jgi:hypothetical protein